MAVALTAFIMRKSTAAFFILLFLPCLAMGQTPAGEKPSGREESSPFADHDTPAIAPVLSPPPASTFRLGYSPSKRWARAAGEVLLMEIVPWSFSRYVTNEDFAYISWDSFRRNWHAGFGWDNDDFRTNQDAHPYHGSLYFNAARTNGFTFWESVPFAVAGSLVWEFAFENTRPSANDFVNTTLGGVARGEAQYRLSRAILDESAHGSERVVRETVAALLNPVGFLNRLLDGNVGKVGPNPHDRLPESLKISVDAGWQHVGGGAKYANQALTSFRIEYGDPHKDGVDEPFDAFVLGGDLVHPGEVLVPRLQVQGILAVWKTASSGNANQLTGAGLRFEYFSTGDTAFGGQGLDFGLLSCWKLPRNLEVRTEAYATAFPVAGIQTDYSSRNLEAVGRTYDYGPGIAARASARLRTGSVDAATMTYMVGWFHTSNGISRGSRLQLISVEGRLGLTPILGVGAGFTWLDRLTTYDSLPAVTWSAPSARLFATWTPEL